MGVEIGFYQIASGGIETVLPRLLERISEAGMRAVVRAQDRALLQLLDERLWTYAPESFLAHGRAGDSDDSAQPILLTSSDEVPNSAHACVLLDPVLPADVQRFERVMLLFAGSDATAAARAAWRSAGEIDGATRSYYTQTNGGGWKKSA